MDLWQRSILMLQAIVERGDAVLRDHDEELPLRLGFKYELVLDAATFDEPANYVLLRMTGDDDPCEEGCAARLSRPLVIFDPRAGHGPGLAGFRADSEIGMALHRGHPVYFVAHRMQPCPEQTLVRVHHALRRFVEEVARRHPGERPALYANCQAGWAVALLAADCAGVTGPTVLNGSPLSYWGGASGINPMRLAGGLTGGAWATRFLADMSAGEFDGAWLVHNFEQLDPGHAWLGKYRDLFEDPQAEHDRFLKFEQWWGQYCSFTREEMLAIVENLFIGNRLEQGKVRICQGCYVDLRRLRSPMLVFASRGDNITPPEQALGWVRAVWPTTEALVGGGHRVCYLVHERVGHLGIFVSAEVARREHRAIMEHLDALETLAPGLYEMVITQQATGHACPDDRYQVEFAPRRVEELPSTVEPESFARVRAISEATDDLYQQTLQPLVQGSMPPRLAAALKWWHPMRLSRWSWAHAVNPLAYAIDFAAAWAAATRVVLPLDHPLRRLERIGLDAAQELSDNVRRVRDDAAEILFAALYGDAADAAWQSIPGGVDGGQPQDSNEAACDCCDAMAKAVA